MMDHFLFLVIVLFAGGLRWLPHLLVPYGVGVDHWFWKAYIEEYRRNKQFPPHLPQFLLDEAQWYPPIFPLAMAAIPLTWFERFSHVLAAAIDIARMLLLMGATYWITASGGATVLAGLVYALTPILVTYNLQLNPRGLGALLLDIIMLLCIGVFRHTLPPGWLCLVVFLSGVLLLTHKMTTQLFWFLCLLVGLFAFDWRPLALIPASVIAACVLSRGFYVKVLRAHWDIVTFWNRNWLWLAAHPVRESPLYRGGGGYETPTKYHYKGWQGWLRRMLFLGGVNPAAWLALLLGGVLLLNVQPGMSLHTELMTWLSIILLFAVMTTVVPWMKCLGNGYLYLYNSAFPASMLWALSYYYAPFRDNVEPLLVLVLLLNAGAMVFYFYTLQHSKTLRVDEEMDKALLYLLHQVDGVVMCFPQHWHDVVAYRTGKKVLFGAHGYGFRRMEMIFPLLRRPIREVVSEYRVRYLLTYKDYLPESFINELPKGNCMVFGDYRLYDFGETLDC